MQPINENNELDAEHTLYVATTGGGKSQAVKRFGRIKLDDQVAYWDPHKDHKELGDRVVRRYSSFIQFAKALRAGRQTKRGFKIALTVPETRENFLQFCKIVWGMGDGYHAKRLHVVCEENPEVTESVGRDNSVFGKLLNVGRKYGHVIHVVGGKTTEMSKSVTSKCVYKWVGMQSSKIEAKRMADEVGVSPAEIESLTKLEYFFKSPGIGNYYRSKLIIRTKQ